jgi:outer membrane immunogenic protein
MKNLLLAGVAFAALVLDGPALAADIPVKSPAPSIAPPYSWTGLYFGVNAGYGVGRDPTTLQSGFYAPLSAEQFSVQPAGPLGGVQLGYNWQLAHWVLGLEADVQVTGQSDSACVTQCNSGSGTVVDQKLPWFGTARGRLGWTNGPMLLYATGGLAYGHVKTTVTVIDDPTPPQAFTFNHLKAGWTLGGGVEAAIGGAWTAKAEYLYVDLGSQTDNFNYFILPFGHRYYVRENVFRVGLNYRFFGEPALADSTMPVKAPVMAAPYYAWSGLYLGLNTGFGIARDPSSYTAAGLQPAADSFKLDPTGWLGGGQFGYNWQSSHWVYGLETDIQATTQKSSTNCLLLCAPTIPTTLQITQKLPWFGTLRGRVGWAEGPVLFYATGGLAYGEVKTTASYLVDTLVGGTSSVLLDLSSTRTGWTAGGGIEAAVGGNWTAKAEYLYIDLGTVSGSFPVDFGLGFTNTNTVSTSFRYHIARVGLNYRL